jgi:hypothetical protein
MRWPGLVAAAWPGLASLRRTSPHRIEIAWAKFCAGESLGRRRGTSRVRRVGRLHRKRARVVLLGAREDLHLLSRGWVAGLRRGGRVIIARFVDRALACAARLPSSGRAAAGRLGGGSRCRSGFSPQMHMSRILVMTTGSWIVASLIISVPHRGQRSGSTSQTRLISSRHVAVVTGRRAGVVNTLNGSHSARDYGFRARIRPVSATPRTRNTRKQAEKRGFLKSGEKLPQPSRRLRRRGARLL